MYRYYYSISFNNQKALVLAESSMQAVNILFEKKKKEFEADNRHVEFDPSSFSIERLEREDFVLKASE